MFIHVIVTFTISSLGFLLLNWMNRFLIVVGNIIVFMDYSSWGYLGFFWSQFLTLKKHEHLFGGNFQTLLFLRMLFTWFFYYVTLFKSKVTSTSPYFAFILKQLLFIFDSMNKTDLLKGECEKCLFLICFYLVFCVGLCCNWLYLWRCYFRIEIDFYWNLIQSSFIRILLNLAFIYTGCLFYLWFTNFVKRHIDWFWFLLQIDILTRLDHFHGCLGFT